MNQDYPAAQFGGKPSTGTPADKRLKRNQPASKKKAAAPKKPAARRGR